MRLGGVLPLLASMNLLDISVGKSKFLSDLFECHFSVFRANHGKDLWRHPDKLTPANIFSRRDRFKVIRIDAVTMPTAAFPDVIKDTPFRDSSIFFFVSSLMNQRRRSWNLPAFGVAFLVDWPKPKVTSGYLVDDNRMFGGSVLMSADESNVLSLDVHSASATIGTRPIGNIRSFAASTKAKTSWVGRNRIAVDARVLEFISTGATSFGCAFCEKYPAIDAGVTFFGHLMTPGSHTASGRRCAAPRWLPPSGGFLLPSFYHEGQR